MAMCMQRFNNSPAEVLGNNAPAINAVFHGEQQNEICPSIGDTRALNRRGGSDTSLATTTITGGNQRNENVMSMMQVRGPRHAHLAQMLLILRQADLPTLAIRVRVFVTGSLQSQKTLTLNPRLNAFLQILFHTIFCCDQSYRILTQRLLAHGINASGRLLALPTNTRGQTLQFITALMQVEINVGRGEVKLSSRITTICGPSLSWDDILLQQSMMYRRNLFARLHSLQQCTTETLQPALAPDFMIEPFSRFLANGRAEINGSNALNGYQTENPAKLEVGTRHATLPKWLPDAAGGHRSRRQQMRLPGHLRTRQRRLRSSASIHRATRRVQTTQVVKLFLITLNAKGARHSQYQIGRLEHFPLRKHPTGRRSRPKRRCRNHLRQDEKQIGPQARQRLASSDRAYKSPPWPPDSDGTSQSPCGTSGLAQSSRRVPTMSPGGPVVTGSGSKPPSLRDRAALYTTSEGKLFLFISLVSFTRPSSILRPEASLLYLSRSQ
jgi:hypothetical protein